MATVTEIREFRGVHFITLDGRDTIKVRKKHFGMRPLRVGDEVDIERYMDAIASVQMQDAYESALCSLDRSAKTESEIVRGLIMRGYVPQCAEAVAARLVENRLVDDQRYAQRIAENNAGKAVGIFAVKRKLRAKGISEEDAEAAMGDFDEEQQLHAAIKAAKSLKRKYEDLPVREARAKLSQAVARRGFTWESVRAAVDAVLDEDFEE